MMYPPFENESLSGQQVNVLPHKELTILLTTCGLPQPLEILLIFLNKHSLPSCGYSSVSFSKAV